MTTSPTKFFEVEGERVSEPNITGVGTWLNLFVGLQQQFPNKKVKCGWVYPDGTISVMNQTAPKYVEVPDPSTKPRGTYRDVEEPGDSGSSYDDYLEQKHYQQNGL